MIHTHLNAIKFAATMSGQIQNACARKQNAYHLLVKTPTLEMLETLNIEQAESVSSNKKINLNYFQDLEYSDSGHYIENAKPLSSKKKRRQWHEGQLS